MKLDLNLATRRPASAEARRIAVAALLLASACFVASCTFAWREHRRVREERALVSRLVMPPATDSAPDPILEGWTRWVAAPRPSFSHVLGALERTLPREVELERMEWTGDALVLTADAPGDKALEAASAAASQAANLSLASTSAQSDRVVAIFRGTPPGWGAEP